MVKDGPPTRIAKVLKEQARSDDEAISHFFYCLSKKEQTWYCSNTDEYIETMIMAMVMRKHQHVV